MPSSTQARRIMLVVPAAPSGTPAVTTQQL
jgi:hypothetical protein